jgi:phage terminase small subunit
MPPLINPRHERFSQALFEGKSANRAYEEAGYRPHDGNAIRLRGNERVKARLAELQEAAAESSQVTASSLLRELEEARLKASSLEQYGTVVKAIVAKASIAGISEQRIHVTHETLQAPDGTVEDIAEWMAWVYEDHKVRLTEAQKSEFVALLLDWHAAIQNFLAPLKAKQINPPQSPAQVIEHERKRLGLVNRPTSR